LRYTDLQGADLRYVELSNSVVSDLDWLVKLKEYKVIGYEEIRINYA